MFSEKLIIKNFGPFTEQIEFEFNKVSVFIGPQASGKSIIAKLITIFRNAKLVDDFEGSLRKFNISVFLNDDTEMSYSSTLCRIIYREKEIEIIGNELIQSGGRDSIVKNIDILQKNHEDKIQMFNSVKEKLESTISKIKSIPEEERQKYINDANELLKELVKYKDESDNIIEEMRKERDKNLERLNALKEISYFIDSYYIPSERLFYTFFKESLASIVQANIPLPQILIDFGAMVENLRNASKTKVLEFQNIEFEHGSDELIILKGNNRIPISSASSGLQSIYSILLICQSLIDKEIYAKENSEYISIAIEEAELNLYPEAQNKIIKRIIEAVNTNDKVRLIITTHSPYILTTINNLLFKSKIEKLIQLGDKKEFTTEITFEDKINFEEISAYSIEQGKADNLVDSQTQLINAKKLDSISYTINSEFSELMSLYRKLNG